MLVAGALPHLEDLPRRHREHLARPRRARPPRRRRAGPSRRPASRPRAAAARRARRASPGGRRRGRSRRRRPRGRRPRACSSERALTTRTFSIPARVAASRMKSHLRATDSIRSTRACGQRDREDEPGKPGAGADVGDRPRRVRAPRPRVRSASRRRAPARPRAGRGPSSGERGSAASSSSTRSSFARASARRAGRSALLGPLVVVAARSRSGATITQRSGSSPSLKVSTPVRSARWSWTTLRSVGRHRLELDLAAGLERPLGGAVGLVLELLAAPLAIARGVDDHALAVGRPALRRAVADELHGVDRLAAAADQPADVLAVDRAGDLPLVLGRRRPSASSSSASTTRSRIARTRSAGSAGIASHPRRATLYATRRRILQLDADGESD